MMCCKPLLTTRTRTSILTLALSPCDLFRPEPHILLFRRPNGTDPATGLVNGKRIDPATGKVVPV